MFRPGVRAFVLAFLVVGTFLVCGCQQGTDKTADPLTPARAAYPSPQNGASDVSTLTGLTWSSAPRTDYYEVYFGTVQSDILSATTSDTCFMGSVTVASYDPGTLLYSATYYWRIDTVNDYGTTKGSVWSFSTVDTVYVDDINGADTNAGASLATAVKTIQKALELGQDGSTVIVADGTYTGASNRDLDFNGKAIYLHSLSGATSCIIDCETGGRGFYFHNGETQAAIVEGFTIQNGSAGAGVYGGGIYCNNASPTITDCTITNNTADNGAGIHCTSISSPTITNCIITDNIAGNTCGGIFCDSNCDVVLNNCTIANNTATSNGGGIYAYNCTLAFNNSIIWGNTAGGFGNQVMGAGTSVVDFNYCDLPSAAQDSGRFGGGGTKNENDCINVDPLFVSAGAGDYYLQDSSLCIDAGNDSYASVQTDIDGNERIVDGTVDLGPYEYPERGPMVLDFINQDRVNASLDPLTWNASWAAACTAHATGLELAGNDEHNVSHYDNEGKQLMDFDGDPGTGYHIVAVAFGFGAGTLGPTNFYNTIKTVTALWDELMNAQTTEFGCGFKDDTWEMMCTYTP